MKKQNNPIPVTLPQTANSITEDNEGNIWISTTDNIYMLEQKNNIPAPTFSYSHSNISQRKNYKHKRNQSDSKGNIWADIEMGSY